MTQYFCNLTVMLWLLLYISIFYLTTADPINIQIDGAVNIVQNWKYDPTAFIDRRDKELETVNIGRNYQQDATDQEGTLKTKTVAEDNTEVHENKHKKKHSELKPVITVEINHGYEKRKRDSTVKSTTINTTKRDDDNHKGNKHNQKGYHKDTENGLRNKHETVTKTEKPMVILTGNLEELGIPANADSKQVSSESNKHFEGMNIEPKSEIKQPNAKDSERAARTDLKSYIKKRDKLFASRTPNVVTTTGAVTMQKRITEMYKPHHKKVWRQNDMYKQALYVRDDPMIKNFTEQIFKQSLDMFAELRSMITIPQLRAKVDYLSRSFKKKFEEFINETQNQKILTRLGHQKVILNTLETSERYKNRLLNYLIAYMWTKGSLRENDPIENVLRTALAKEENREYADACQFFNVCRTKTTFSEFVSAIFTILLQVEDAQLRQSIDALTEILKNTDFTIVFNKKMQGKFLKFIERMEKTDTKILRPVIWILRNTIASKNQPLVIPENTSMDIVNKTVALIEVLDIFDNQITPTEENILQWADVKNSLVQWANKYRDDIQDILQVSVRQLLRKGLKKMDSEMLENLQDKLKMIIV